MTNSEYLYFSYLLPDKGRSSKQKTNVARKTCNPNWNQTITYRDVSPEELADKSLELTVWDHDRLGSNEFLGGVRLSLGSGNLPFYFTAIIYIIIPIQFNYHNIHVHVKTLATLICIRWFSISNYNNFHSEVGSMMSTHVLTPKLYDK